MIDVKQAVQLAKDHAAEMLEKGPFSLEEIERDSYKSRDVWSITLSSPRDTSSISALSRLASEPYQYKRFLIDVENGDLLAMKLRETLAR